MLKTIGVVAALCPAVARPAASQEFTVTGFVRDSTLGAAISGVRVTDPSGRRVDTDQSGRFTLRVTNRRTAMISFRRLGFAPVERAAVPAPGSNVVDLGVVEMVPLAVTLDPIRVEQRQRKVDIVGVILDSATGQPLENTRVWVTSGQISQTDKRGAFHIKQVQGAAALLLVRRIGYMPMAKRVVLAKDSSTVIRVDSLGLVAIAFRLDSLKIETTLTSAHAMYRDFYRRKSTRRGMYLTADEIWKKNPKQATDVFWGILGASRRCAMGDPNESGCWMMLNGCRAHVFVNGMSAMFGMTLDDVPPQSIVGVEIYRSRGDVPGELVMKPRCGAIVVWTTNKDILTWAAYREEP